MRSSIRVPPRSNNHIRTAGSPNAFQKSSPPLNKELAIFEVAGVPDCPVSPFRDTSPPVQQLIPSLLRPQTYLQLVLQPLVQRKGPRFANHGSLDLAPRSPQCSLHTYFYVRLHNPFSSPKGRCNSHSVYVFFSHLF